MSSRSVNQLKKMAFVYSDLAGSSKHFREYLQSSYFNDLKNTNSFEHKLMLKRNGHPFITAVYINGYVKTIPLVNKSIEDIIRDIDNLKNSCMLTSWTSVN